MDRRKFLRYIGIGIIGACTFVGIVEAKPAKPLRRVEVYDKGWRPSKMEDIRAGNKFRMYEPDSNELVCGKSFTAKKDAYYDYKHKVWGVLAE